MSKYELLERPLFYFYQLLENMIERLKMARLSRYNCSATVGLKWAKSGYVFKSYSQHIRNSFFPIESARKQQRSVVMKLSRAERSCGEDDIRDSDKTPGR